MDKKGGFEVMQCDLKTDASISDAIVLLGRQFNKILMRMERKPRSNVKNFVLSNVDASGVKQTTDNVEAS
ncbi:hypothetical protein A2U01_0061534, partial [Trifolium medium]|nr:hypothetical protein [Trifolium medium]